MSTRPPGAADRFAERIVRLHRELSFAGLPDAIEGTPAFAATSPFGLTVLTVLGSQLPPRYLWALYGFRLAQYLQRGWASREVVYAKALTAEAYGEEARDDYHTVVLEQKTGRIRGYGTLQRSRDPHPTRMSDPSRSRLVVERDYGIDLAEHLDGDPWSEQVWEAKRLVRDYDMDRSPAAIAVPWWVYEGAVSVVVDLFDSGRAVAVTGDAKKSGAIFQFGLLGFEVQTLDVAPREPDPADLFAPLWDQPEKSRPFILRDGPRLRPTLRALGDVLAEPIAGSVRRRLETRTRELPYDDSR